MAKTRTLLLPFFYLLTLNYSGAQGLSAFLNIRSYFYVFDNPITREIDQNKPLNFKIGGNCVAYLSSNSSFVVYQKGKVIKVNDGFTTDYTMTSDYILMINGTSLYVFDNGKSILLARNPIEYSASDSIIGFADPVTKRYYIYTAGHRDSLTDDVIFDPIKIKAIGKNLIAYTTLTDSFKIYYHGKIYPQPVQFISDVQAGGNIVAYSNDYDHEFRVFYKGHTVVLETFHVNDYYTGDDLVAYTTQDGKFKIFYDGVVYTIGTFTPDKVAATDNLIIYANELGYFMVFYKGKMYQLDQYVPDHFEAGQNSLYYIGRDQRINFFSYGKYDELPMDNYVKVRLDYDVLQIELPLSQFKFYYRGDVY